jgi:hypothetical protein
VKQLTDNLLQCIIVGSRIQPHGTRFPRQKLCRKHFSKQYLTIPDSIKWTASGVITIAVVVLANGQCAV